MEATTKRSPGSNVVPDPVIEFGPFTHFGLRRPDQKSAGGAGPAAGHHNQPSESSPFSFLDSLFGVSRRASAAKPVETVYQILNDESLTMAELGVTSGCEFILIGGVRRKSEKAQCIGGLFAGANPQAISYYNCQDCATQAMCYGCASHCHAGHAIVMTPKADQPVLKPNMNGHTLCVCSCSIGGGGSCPIRDPIPVPAALPYYTHELNLLRAMGFTDAAVAHLSMPAPLPMAIPPPPPPIANSAPIKAQPQMVNGSAPAAPAPALDSKLAPAASGEAKAAPAPVDAKHSPVLAPAAPAPAPAPAPTPTPTPAPVAVAVTSPPLISVSLRALLQSKGGNVQAVVDTLLQWEKQGLMKSPKSSPPQQPIPAASAAPTPAPAPAAGGAGAPPLR